jgi:beta-glucosidase
MKRTNAALFAILVTAGLGFFSLSMILAGPAGPKPLSSYDAQVSEVMARMTMDEKVGQMTQADQQFLKEIGDIQAYKLGSLLNGGDSDPKTNSLEDWTDMYDRYQSQAVRTRLGIPLLYGVDAVHGHNNVLGAVIFPHNIGMGCTRSAKLVEQAARITAEEVRATGINWAFAPCLTVPQDIRWGRTYEGFAEDPAVVRMLAEAAVRGLQGRDLADPLGVLACAKHFVGDGGTQWGSGAPKSRKTTERWPLDRGDTRIDERTLRQIHLPGYVSAMRAGAGSIMVSYSSWNGVKCSASKRLLTEILKQELGFEGFLISDYNALDELPGNSKEQIELSINAGMDMVMVPSKYREFIGNLKQLVEEGKVQQARIDDAVRRILRVKFAMGLMDRGRSPLADRGLHKAFGTAEHRAAARECVRQSLVLLKNENQALPLPKRLARIHVAGKGADNIGIQCGGWTIAWQGKSGPVTTGGTTILQAIRSAVGPGTKVTFSEDGSQAAGANAGIAVVGEKPYAEMRGDTDNPALAPEDVQAIESMKKAGLRVVVVLLSGRPLVAGRALDQADAFIAAWLPGTEGQGVADVLFGDYRPTGKLSFSWPRSAAQLPMNIHSPKYDPLFKYGYGLTY